MLVALVRNTTCHVYMREMSKLSEYSKFDHLDTSSDEEEGEAGAVRYAVKRLPGLKQAMSNLNTGVVETINDNTGVESWVTLPEPSDSALPCLGGIPEDAVNKVCQEHEVYASLPRPGKLPPPPFKSMKRTDRQALAVFHKLWDGHLSVRWIEKTDRKLVAVIKPNGEDVPEKFSKQLVLIKLDRFDEYCVMESSFTPINAEFSAAIKQHHKESLAHRIFYHILRSFGTDLMALDAGLVDQGCTLFKDRNKDNVETLLDIAILCCDLAINHSETRAKIGGHLTKVGEVLEAMGEFEKAARLYRHTADIYFLPALSLDKHSSLVEYSGLAYRRDFQLEKAEESYIRALHFRRLACQERNGVWDLNESKTNLLLRNMLMAFEERNLQKGSRIVHVSSGEIFHAFCALLYTAGFNSSSDERQDLVLKYGKELVPLLNYDIQSNPQAALAVLIMATESPEKDHFYSVLMDSVPRNAFFEFYCDDYDPARPFSAPREHSMKTAQRTAGVMGSSRSFSFAKCHYQNCPTENKISNSMKRCPCRTAVYCQKSCQVADWPAHKKVCPWKARQKKKEGAAGKSTK